MSNDRIKKLARITIRNTMINPKVTKYVLFKLNRKELIIYLAAFKKVIYGNSLRVVSREELPTKTKQSIKSRFKDRVVFFEQDEDLSDGIKIIMDDSVIDLTFNGYINNTLEQLKI